MRDSIFISYSHQDKRFLDEFQTMLAPMQRNDAIRAWADTRIKAGAKWQDEISQAMAKAKAAVMLVSPEFLASDFIAKHELPPLLKAAEKDGLTVFWVCISPCLYNQTEIGDYQAFHPPTDPLGKMSKIKRGDVWMRLCEALKEVESIGPSDDDNVIEPDLRKTAQDLIVAILQKSDAATLKLADRFDLDKGQIVECRRRVAEKTLNTPLEELFEIGLEEQQGLDRDGSDVISRLVQATLPFLNASEDAEADAMAIRKSHAIVPNTLHELHASHKTFAELIMAKANRRPTTYLRPRNPNEFPGSDACLPYPPEGGRDSDGLQFKKDFTEELAQKVEPLIDSQFKDKFTQYLRGRFTDPNTPLANEDALIYWINDGLSRDANRRKRQYLPVRCGFTYYFLVETPVGLDDALRKAQDAVLLDLKARFSDIAFLRLAPPDPLLSELRPYSQLIDLLCT